MDANLGQPRASDWAHSPHQLDSQVMKKIQLSLGIDNHHSVMLGHLRGNFREVFGGISRITNGWAMLPSMCLMISLLSSNGFPSTRPLPTLWGAPTFSVRRLRSREQYVVVCARSLAFRSRSAWHAPSISRKSPRMWPSLTGWWLSTPRLSWISFTTCLSS